MFIIKWQTVLICTFSKAFSRSLGKRIVHYLSLTCNYVIHDLCHLCNYVIMQIKQITQFVAILAYIL